MISEGHLFVGLLLRKPEENKGDNKSKQISDKMKSIANNRNGMGNISSHELSGDEHK